MNETTVGVLAVIVIITGVLNLIKDIILDRRREKQSKKRIDGLQHLQKIQLEAADLEQANWELIQDNNRYKTALNFVAQGWNRGNPSFAKYVLDGMSSSEAYKLAQEDRK
jgi:hypothetical protein